MREEVLIDISGIRKSLERLPSPKGFNRKQWTKEEDDLLREFWPVKKHRDVAKILGVSKDTALERYRELIS